MTRFHILSRFRTQLARVYWFLFRPETRGAKVLLRHGDEILLIRNTYGSRRWNLPGGGVEAGEEPEAAARREIWEELQIRIDQVELLGGYQTTKEYKRDTVYCFLTEVTSQDYLLDPVEILEARWFKISELPVKLSLSVEKALEFLLEQSISR